MTASPYSDSLLDRVRPATRRNQCIRAKRSRPGFWRTAFGQEISDATMLTSAWHPVVVPALKPMTLSERSAYWRITSDHSVLEYMLTIQEHLAWTQRNLEREAWYLAELY